MTEVRQREKVRVLDIASINRRRELINPKVHRLQSVSIVEYLVVMMSNVDADSSVEKARQKDYEDPKLDDSQNIWVAENAHCNWQRQR